MAKKFAKLFYSSPAWIKCRAAFIKNRIAADGGLCQLCKKEQGFIVHHVTQLSEANIDNPEITLNWDNLQYVCKRCHDRIDGHFIKKSSDDDILPEIIFDNNGNPIPRYNKNF